MTIAAENQKTLRPSMLVACGIDTYAEQVTVTPTIRYGSGAYDDNMRAGVRGLSIRLMDLAGGGFPLDGTRHPINSELEPDDGDATVVDSYKGYVKYGIPASLASDSYGITSSIGFSVGDIPDGVGKLTAHLRDSNGKTYRVTGTTAAALQSAVRNLAITPGARLYVDRVTAGDSWQWDKSELISCELTLRGVETKGNNPELQMSEVEINGVIDEEDIDGIAGMSENSPIWYVAGYADEVTPVRRFYLSEGITTENIVATIKGYDATKFLEETHHGVVSVYTNGFCFGKYMRAMARRCYGILGRGLIYDHKSEFARTPANKIKGEESSDTDVRYLSLDNLPRRSVIAAHCNLMRSPTGGLGNTGVYCDYVDAGLPTMQAGLSPIGLTNFGREWYMDQGDVVDFVEECEVAISEISTEVNWPKKETDTKGNTKYTSFYAETINRGDSRFIEAEEAYTGIKFKGYDKVERETPDGAKSWIHSPIGNLHKIKGHYYPDTKKFGHSCYDFKIKSLKTAKQRLIGVRNVRTHPESLPGLPSGFTYDDGTLTYQTGRKGEAVTFPEVFVATMEQASSVSGGRASGVKSLWGLFLKQIGDRSNVVYKFQYRGNPKMQPRDIIHMTIDGEVIDMTIDNLTLEHSEGGLISSIECRKGII